MASQLDSAVSYQNGGKLPPALKIDLHSRRSEEIFKWFLAAALFGARISIGDITVNIFLRKLRGIWQRANSELSKLALVAACNLGLLEPKIQRGTTTLGTTSILLGNVAIS